MLKTTKAEMRGVPAKKAIKEMMESTDEEEAMTGRFLHALDPVLSAWVDSELKRGNKPSGILVAMCKGFGTEVASAAAVFSKKGAHREALQGMAKMMYADAMMLCNDPGFNPDTAEPCDCPKCATKRTVN